MKYPITIFSIAAILFSASTLKLNASGRSQEDGEALFIKAYSLSNLKAEGSPSYVMNAIVDLYGASSGHETGKYQIVWGAPGEVRTAISLPDYYKTTVSHAGKGWLSSNISFLPYYIFLLQDAFSFPSRLTLKPNAKEKFTKVQERKINGASLECAGYITKGFSARHEFCFDLSTGYLIREIDPKWFVTLEYSNYAPIGNKIFPRTLRVLQDGNLVLEARVTDVTQNITLTSAMLAPPPRTRITPFAQCTADQLKTVRVTYQVAPQYPPNEEELRVGGLVILYLDICIDGVPRGITVLHAPNVNLADAVIASVSQWRYASASCRGIPIDTPSSVDVNFNIMHR